VTPKLTTKAGPGVILGSAITDSATLIGTAPQPATPVINTSGAAGSATAGGDITFKLYGPDNCTSLVHTSAKVTVNGDDTYNTPDPQFVPKEPGTYHWVAAYSGSSPNTRALTHNADCKDPAESVVVDQPKVSLTSVQSWVPNDSVTVKVEAGTLSGKVSFELYPSSDCTGTVQYSYEDSVSGAASRTVTTSNTKAVPAGKYSWLVSYTASSTTQRSIAPTCHETSGLTIDNGGTVSNPSS
jgi:hypothetical protein